MNYYSTLSISPSADSKTIKLAYIKFLEKHIDVKFPEKHIEEGRGIGLLNSGDLLKWHLAVKSREHAEEAYAVLSSPAKRRHYDTKLAAEIEFQQKTQGSFTYRGKTYCLSGNIYNARGEAIVRFHLSEPSFDESSDHQPDKIRRKPKQISEKYDYLYVIILSILVFSAWHLFFK